MLTLNISLRDKKKSIDYLRKNGEIPGVFYGKGRDSTPISLSLNEFTKVWKSAGESTVVVIKTPDGKEIEALIYEVDKDPITEVPRHVDFYVFEKGHKIQIEIPLEFIGISTAVKDYGGVLVKSRHEIEIESIPKNLPQQIEVDISALDSIGSQIVASQINLPSGVMLIGDPDETIISVAEPQAEVEEEVPPIDMSSIKVEKKGKEKEIDSVEIDEKSSD